MKKRICAALAFALLCCVTVMAAGCGAESGKASASFHAVVLEVHETESGAAELIVRPDDGSDELRSADRISVGVQNARGGGCGFSVGDHVRISYNGEIMETYPARLGGAVEVTPVD